MNITLFKILIIIIFFNFSCSKKEKLVEDNNKHEETVSISAISITKNNNVTILFNKEVNANSVKIYIDSSVIDFGKLFQSNILEFKYLLTHKSDLMNIKVVITDENKIITTRPPSLKEGIYEIDNLRMPIIFGQDNTLSNYKCMVLNLVNGNYSSKPSGFLVFYRLKDKQILWQKQNVLLSNGKIALLNLEANSQYEIKVARKIGLNRLTSLSETFIGQTK